MRIPHRLYTYQLTLGHFVGCVIAIFSCPLPTFDRWVDGSGKGLARIQGPRGQWPDGAGTQDRQRTQGHHMSQYTFLHLRYAVGIDQR
ncbi:hypothetical protein PLICRDRAFT_34305 [Plicaturopsis crispa FD-325 SS-3]|nr:hypothetical protein PLICRDRAFT_34305 [Plicaturopsis crispa FD-325 SS-3]